MEHYFILNLFLVVTMLSVWYPTEVQGYESLDYPTRGYYNYLWRRFNHLKRTEKDGQFDSNANKMDFPNDPIYPTNESPEPEWGRNSINSTTNKKRINNVKPDYEIKVLYGRVPGAVMFWPSAL